ncbi:aminomethyl-transferring glycine dehydrogenase subunit GcvPB [Ochrobactrum sp. SFR4]|uniref:aminomethyl-transferring glycine dehydrogenase subunit GcvPB n=1 Tax=Ochrobactrum sp. SFR4 TaxID=2717368 RepID=UPI001C8B0D32|nr:aminomethyl-transferring glycine dehydrogenase subunit GcvPB [Ochrobactrum sp. SFR4]MBX8827355.1 aminotransferase class V-fold PLP-dependent enzyme [Ochrobactrum sp. SFR4]
MTSELKTYHAPVWNEPVIMEMGYPGRRGVLFSQIETEICDKTEEAVELIPAALRRRDKAALPELSEPEVLYHYLRLSQQTLGMMGTSLFGTCTMKYNAQINEAIAWRPEITQVHPYQPEDTLQGTLEVIHRMDLIMRELSGMDQFVFHAGGGADAAYLNCCVARAYHASRGELQQRDEIITTIQTHPSSAATAATAGFKVITLMLDENGYPSLDALKAAVSERTAALMVNNPDDMGVYNPEIKEWVRIVHDAGGLCFYDHANFNGVMSKIRARELGFDACMFMLHKTFGAPKSGVGGPASGAYGCSEKLAPFLPSPTVGFDGQKYFLDDSRAQSVDKVREFWGNVQVILKGYAWVRAMGAEGIAQAANISVLANNYMERGLLAIRGVTRSHPEVNTPRLEMTRYSLQNLKEETGVDVQDVQNRMTDFGIDAMFSSHEPWLVPEPFTPEAGEMYGKEALDRWIAVLSHISEEAHTNPQLVKTAPHNQAIHRLKSGVTDDPATRAMTWRAHQKKKSALSAHK